MWQESTSLLSRHEAGRLGRRVAIVRLSRSAFVNQSAKAAAVTEQSERGVAVQGRDLWQAKDESRAVSALAG